MSDELARAAKIILDHAQSLEGVDTTALCTTLSELALHLEEQGADGNTISEAMLSTAIFLTEEKHDEEWTSKFIIELGMRRLLETVGKWRMLAFMLQCLQRYRRAQTIHANPDETIN